MKEQNLNFDEVIDRKNTDCLKFDFAKKRGRPENVLPLWVADMDFKTSSIVIDEIKKRVEHGIFGYTEVLDDYFDAVSDWLTEKHNWTPKSEWLLKTPGVVFALAMAVKAYTNAGDSVLIQQPVYYPFTEVIEDNGRKVVSNDLVLRKCSRYRIDFEDFEKKIIKNKIKLFLFCSPHNPVGRVWTKKELLKIGEICLKHHVIIVSDEIHQDFVFGENKHYVFAGLKKEFEDISITCTSPAKTFNLAGLQVSNIFIPNETLRYQFKKQIDAAGYSQLSTMGLVACKAAYRYGVEWYQAMMRYVKENIEFTRQYLKHNIPQLHMIEPEGTYLLWLDFRKLSLTGEELEDFIVHKAHLWLDGGEVFGESGLGFERINVACPKSTLVKALNQLKEAVDSLGGR